MLKCALIFEQKRLNFLVGLQRLRALPLDPCELTHTYCTVTKHSTFVTHKNVNSDQQKFCSILLPPLFVIVPLHFSWYGDSTDVITLQSSHCCFIMKF